ncbi:MAG: multicopper oxidase domain-containing protein [Candidatus Methylomirabilales bacterium]|nr:multicopper oxidase domain-containing protein [candidate division NC10 bacterium]MCZ6550851.1 multicopper oxidase domain-containing protein [candidate division NC10 bacterium]
MEDQRRTTRRSSLLTAGLSRRRFLGGLVGLGFLGTATTALTDSPKSHPAQGGEPGTASLAPSPYPTHPAEVPQAPAADLPAPSQVSDPMTFLTTFDYGRVQRLAGGRVQREYTVVALDREIEVAPGVKFPAWTLNGYVPGPTLRCREGDLIKIHFLNESSMPHTMHFHGFHPANMDGVFEIIPPGSRFSYEFTAEPFGVHLYHCHVMPLKKHIHKGLYGTFIVDPPQPRPPAKEMVMVMNGYDTDFDNDNEFYTLNGVANYFVEHPIEVRQHEPLRIYLVNITEFDLLNSIHTHATFFKFYRTGTRLDQYDYTDTVMLCQGERGIMEYTYKFPGVFMFHAHQSEFAELGWLGFFKVLPAEGKA